jgi:hypothetical protein
MTGNLHLCWLHEDDEEDHWVPAAELVGVIPGLDGRPMPEWGMSQAAHRCATRNGVEADRIVAWDPEKVGASSRVRQEVDR